MLAALAAGSGRTARAELELDYSIRIQNDLRLDVDRVWQVVPDTSDDVGSVIEDAGETRFSRNETSARIKAQVAPTPRARFVGDVELIWLNLSDRLLELGELTGRETMDPWRLECHAAYVDLYGIAPGLDLRLGRQKVQWGSADLFNPTDNLNPDDLEDQLLFGDNIANEMIRLDYSFLPERLEWLDEVSVSFVWVPVFRPAQLSWASTLTPYQGDPLPVVEDDIREAAAQTREMFSDILNDPVVTVELPRFSLANSQLGLRVLARMLGVDFTLSYYRGFEDIPVMTRVANALTDDASRVNTAVTMSYPRMQVLGFDINGQIEALGQMGFWVEGAVIFPERLPLVLETNYAPLVPVVNVSEGTVVEGRPFLKLTVGFDHSIGQHVFLDVQWVHGFIDDFGASNLSDFLVAGFDVKLWNERIVLKFWGMLQLDWLDDAVLGHPWAQWRDELSASLRPTFRFIPWSSIELELGAVIPFGGTGSYFEQPRAGTTQVFLRVRASI